MKFVKKNWKSRSTIVVGISLLVGILMIALEQTQFAIDINSAGWHHGGEGEGRPNIPGAVLFILPFVKALALIGVPLLVARLIVNIIGLFTRKR
ncbi:hypothetical protein Q4574_13225 [Aliiglaciecola sp. 3_MG-2023]|uniref:hypothetical protein n=1 Tax=Aliiglaciecola sp. 3_MG-2023 TaxID=3062644 RepID=UPI0026E43A87|nr:hypothetical protein [Aliiglaciecola sp. 3_MG-2023]MDO6694249.1 hypothetical protein [Aliiglaciecola sp. 3_MG-2023]